uniref:Uncharacterized protein n=1 Tax=Ignisphaera aggregans TaxID=334771 RepID=A0A7J2U160_9CREN
MAGEFWRFREYMEAYKLKEEYERGLKSFVEKEMPEHIFIADKRDVNELREMFSKALGEDIQLFTIESYRLPATGEDATVIGLAFMKSGIRIACNVTLPHTKRRTYISFVKAKEGAHFVNETELEINKSVAMVSCTVSKAPLAL